MSSLAFSLKSVVVLKITEPIVIKMNPDDNSSSKPIDSGEDDSSSKTSPESGTPQGSPSESGSGLAAEEDVGPSGVICADCGGSDSLVWRRVDSDTSNTSRIMCNECAGKQKRVRSAGSMRNSYRTRTTQPSSGNALPKSDLKDEANDSNETKDSTVEASGASVVRKSVRSKRGTKVNHSTPKNHPTKGKGRRHIFKQQVSRLICAIRIIYRSRHKAYNDLPPLVSTATDSFRFRRCVLEHPRLDQRGQFDLSSRRHRIDGGSGRWPHLFCPNPWFFAGRTLRKECGGNVVVAFHSSSRIGSVLQSERVLLRTRWRSTSQDVFNAICVPCTERLLPTGIRTIFLFSLFWQQFQVRIRLGQFRADLSSTKLASS